MSNKVLVTLLVLVIIVAAVFLFRMETQAPTEPEVEEEESVITVEELTVNGEAEEVVLDTDDETVIAATLTNETDAAEEITIAVKEDGEVLNEKHTWTYSVGPGETNEIEEVKEEHHTWYPGEFTVEAGDKSVEMVVEEAGEDSQE